MFLGYIEFSNYIHNTSQVDVEIKNKKQRNKNMKIKLQRVFNNRLIIIDEVHNIRMADDKHKRVATTLEKMVKNVENLRLLLLSATPMYNSYKEIVWLVNLMNINDKRPTIQIKDIFDKNGNFKIDKDGKEIGKELLQRRLIGYVSFVRGDNPYTFPYRIWPNQFSPENTLKEYLYPREQLNGKTLVQGIEHIECICK